MEISYLREACDVRNENMHETCGMGTHTNGVLCSVVEWVKRNTFRSFVHMERKKSE